jgi:hypothetical protein
VRRLFYSTLLISVPWGAAAEGRCVTFATNETADLETIVLYCPTSTTEPQLREDVDRFAESRSVTPSVSMIIAAPSRLTLQFAAVSFEPGAESDDGLTAVIREHEREQGSQLSMSEIVLRRLRIGSEIQYAFCCSATGTAGALDVHRTGAAFAYSPSSATRPNAAEPVRLLWLSESRSPVLSWSQLRLFGYTAGNPTCSQCQILLREVFDSKIPNYAEIEIRVRNSLWFDGAGYPRIFKFTPTASTHRRYLTPRPGTFRLPNAHEYYHLGREVWCRFLQDREKLSCELSGHWGAEDAQRVQTGQ